MAKATAEGVRRACVDCRWMIPYEQPEHMRLSRCSHPEEQKPAVWNPVTGEGMPPEPSFCSNARSQYGRCGASASLFESLPLTNSPAPKEKSRTGQLVALFVLGVLVGVLVVLLCLKTKAGA